MFLFSPTTDYRYAFKRGMRGTDVAALQVNLWVGVDGDFGPRTERAAVEFQERHDLLGDGIAGPATQQALCVERSTPAARHHGLPVGLAKSIMAAESGFFVGAVSRHPSDAGLDVGVYQRSSGPGPGTQDFYRSAYDIGASAEKSTSNLAAFRKACPSPVDSPYLAEMADGDRDHFRWQLAVLNHNWPSAAYNIPRRGHIFIEAARDDQPAEWVRTASGGRLSTPRQWVVSYVERSTVFTRW